MTTNSTDADQKQSTSHINVSLIAGAVVAGVVVAVLLLAACWWFRTRARGPTSNRLGALMNDRLAQAVPSTGPGSSLTTPYYESDSSPAVEVCKPSTIFSDGVVHPNADYNGIVQIYVNRDPSAQPVRQRVIPAEKFRNGSGSMSEFSRMLPPGAAAAVPFHGSTPPLSTSSRIVDSPGEIGTVLTTFSSSRPQNLRDFAADILPDQQRTTDLSVTFDHNSSSRYYTETRRRPQLRREADAGVSLAGGPLQADGVDDEDARQASRWDDGATLPPAYGDLV